MHFEWSIEQAVADFAASLPPGARVLDAGAGEGRFSSFFAAQRYCGVDLGIGDAGWNYAGLDAIADLQRLPFPDRAFNAAINIVTLEHVRDPAGVLSELARVSCPGGRLLLIAPHQWEEHQTPHDYFRYTRHGLAFLLKQAGFRDAAILPVGGFFRLLSRRLLNALQFFPGPAFFLAAIFFVPPALLLPLLDPLDSQRHFTLGYICIARRA
jgi:ubiquinone/menaquinone biosynthesis C-methylase UbiE